MSDKKVTVGIITLVRDIEIYVDGFVGSAFMTGDVDVEYRRKKTLNMLTVIAEQMDTLGLTGKELWEEIENFKSSM